MGRRRTRLAILVALGAPATAAPAQGAVSCAFEAGNATGLDGRDHVVGAGGQGRLRGVDDPDTVLACDGALGARL